MSSADNHNHPSSQNVPNNNDDGKNIIEIHLKSIFNQEQELGK